MSLDKAIMYGKEYRRPYRGAKAVVAIMALVPIAS